MHLINGDEAEETVPVQQEDTSLGPIEVDDAAPTPPKRSRESSALMTLLGPAYMPKATVPQKTPADKAQEEINGYREVKPVPLRKSTDLVEGALRGVSFSGMASKAASLHPQDQFPF